MKIGFKVKSEFKNIYAAQSFVPKGPSFVNCFICMHGTLRFGPAVSQGIFELLEQTKGLNWPIKAQIATLILCHSKIPDKGN